MKFNRNYEFPIRLRAGFCIKRPPPYVALFWGVFRTCILLRGTANEPPPEGFGVRKIQSRSSGHITTPEYNEDKK